jgi:flagellar hook assembly protein FlgD
VATIGAFVISQHLKVTTPFISGVSGPTPPAINPLHGPIACVDPASGRKVSERSTTVSFYVVHHADDINVYVVDQSGATVRTIARGVPMHKPKAPTPDAFRAVTKYFSWNGRNGAGRLVAPGSYFFRVYLNHQQRTIELQQPVRVVTATRCVWNG